MSALAELRRSFVHRVWWAAGQCAHTLKLDNFVFTPAYTLTVSTPSYSGLAGEMKGMLDSDASFATWCTEITQTFAFGTAYTDYAIQSGISAWGAAKADELGKLLTAASLAGQPTGAAASAAIQAGIWEVIYETSGTYDLSSGSFTASSSNAATQSLLDLFPWALIASTPSAYSVDKLASPHHQDFLIVSDIPEPSTYLMIAAGLFAMGAVSTHRRRRTR